MSRRDKLGSELTGIYGVLMELKKQVGEINGKLEQIDQRLTRVEERLDRLEHMIYRNNNRISVKYFIIMIGLVLSFVATMFGLGWRPP